MGNCLEKVTCARRFFVKYFVVSLLMLWVLSLLSLYISDWQYDFVSKLFDISLRDYNMGLFLFIAFWKLCVIQFALIPAVALWWLEKCLKKCNK